MFRSDITLGNQVAADARSPALAAFAEQRASPVFEDGLPPATYQSIHLLAFRSERQRGSVSVAWEARRLDRHSGCSHESGDDGQWSSHIIEDALDRPAAGGNF